MRLFCLEKRRLQGDLMAPSSTQRCYKRAGEGLLIWAWSDRTRRNDFKLKGSRCRLVIKNKSFTVMEVRPWHGVPREAAVSYTHLTLPTILLV